MGFPKIPLKLAEQSEQGIKRAAIAATLFALFHRCCESGADHKIGVGCAMRTVSVWAIHLAVAALILGQSPAIAQTLTPPKRLIISENTDLAGGDIASIFDTTLEACEMACLTNTSCEAFTFNTRNGSCFPKAGAGDPGAYEGAYSGTVITADPQNKARANLRRGEIGFVQDWELAGVFDQANTLANLHITNGYTAEDHRQAATASEQAGDPTAASSYMGAALNITDKGSDWAEYARLLLAAGALGGDAQRSHYERAYNASINAYLRSDDAALRHTVLVTMGDALEQLDRGRDKVAALRLAQDLQSRDDTAIALEDAIGKYGFRVVETVVQSDLERPQICVNFSEPLVKTGTDYADFVALGDPTLTVTSDGYQQLCVGGITHGSRQTFTLRAGLPSLDGQVLAKPVEIAAYVRDRSPGVRFPGRGYVLPRGGDAFIPVQTVNTKTLDLTLFRVTDRNLLRSLQSGFLGAPLQEYQEYDFKAQIGTQLWSGTADVTQDINTDVTTRLPMSGALAGQSAGIYALRAAVPGVDPYTIPASWQWFVVSDLGLTTLSGVDGLHVFVRTLGTADAVTGAEVQLLSEANEILGTAQSDAQGYASFPAGLTRGVGAAAPVLIVAHNGAEDLAFLSLKDPEFDLSDRGVAGREAAPPVDIFLTTDRGAYRAGETVFAAALARDSNANAVENLPLTAILKRPDGIEYARALVADGGAGGHVFNFPIAGTAPRGVWRLEMFADLDASALTSKTFLVEDFLPEKIDFALALNDAEIRLGDAPELAIDAKYLFGAVGSDLTIEGEVALRAASDVPGWPSYVFGRHDAAFSAVLEPFGGDKTGPDGTAKLALHLPEIDDPAIPLELAATVRLAEGSGRPVERKITKPLTPSAAMIGIKPLFDGTVPEGGEARFDLVAVAPDGTATAMAVNWVITKIETNYQWYQNGGAWNWEPVIKRSKVNEGKLDLASTAAQIAVPMNWGEFEISVQSADGKIASSTLFSAGWYGGADASASPDMLEMSLDKPAYNSGETATLRMVPRAAGTALISVLSNHVIATQTVQVTAGENKITLPVSDEWGAGVYVAASVLRPMDVTAGRNPARALGISYASVDPGAHALNAVIETATTAAPHGPMDVAVKVDGIVAGETAYVTIAAVDQGILNLTGFAPPNPNAHYFGQRKLGVGIRDIYGRLIDGMNGAAGTVRSGGDAGAQARLQAPPPTEELVSFFTGPIAVDADGYARATFALPAFNGTVKVMAVAWSKTGVGQANADVLVRDPVVISASLPRFMSQGDHSRLLLEFTHTAGAFGAMQLAVTAPGLTLGEVPKAVDLADQGKARLSIPITADIVGDQVINVALTTPDGKVLVKTLTLPVQINDAPITRISRLDLKSGQTFTFDQAAFTGMLPRTARAVLAVGPIARLNAPGVLAALETYPYECTEQITSKAMPLLYFADIATAMNLPSALNIPDRVQQAIAAVLVNQNASGAFGLWGAGDGGDMWLDAFVSDFLSRARAKGFAVPDIAFRQALDNLRNQVNYQADFDHGGEGLAYALMVLAREGGAAIGDLRYYADVKGDAFATPTAMAQLGAALASYGDQTRADAMFARANVALNVLDAADGEQILRPDYGTHFRDAAAVLALASEAGSKAIDVDALTSRISAVVGLSPQDSVWALLAANALLDRKAADEVLVNGAPAAGPLIKVMDSPETEPVIVQNTGGDTTLTVTTTGIASNAEPAGGAGYAITRSYYQLDGTPATLDGLKVGMRLVTVLEVTPFGRGEARLMVNDPLPAGMEIDNPNLIGSASEALADFDLLTDVAHSEFRQERFLTAVDRSDNTPFRLAYVVRAVSPGQFHQPAATVEDMYRPDLSGRSETGLVVISE